MQTKNYNSELLKQDTELKNYVLYQLEICVKEQFYKEVSLILGYAPTPTSKSWLVEFRSNEKGKENVDFVDYFLSILDGKYDELKQIGINRYDIFIWYVYYSAGHCNMEFSPEQMYKLGKEGISLLVSCYDADNEICK
ncbi:MAG: hypothetical protein LBE91_22050 [Tannerella sp.]|jgi:hypothetical protein|nr:hypothetical protein [Tannerella sp.]